MQPHFVLLLGAGFSRNWGGWLADEVFEYLLGCRGLEADVRTLLWQHRESGGFEGALASLQLGQRRNKDGASERKLRQLEAAVHQMFEDMNRAFMDSCFVYDPRGGIVDELNRFLARFDAIFTLNQDILLERCYLPRLDLLDVQRWGGALIPGMKPVTGGQFGASDHWANRWEPDGHPIANIRFIDRMQPFFKLHGSSNWVDEKDGRLLVVGGGKAEYIGQHPLLKWMHDQFRLYLERPRTRLMVIGYSFRDRHINQLIMDAAKRTHLELFIIDTRGVRLLDVPALRDDSLVDTSPQRELSLTLTPRLIGGSQRALTTTFGTDTVERSKLMRFFE